MDGFWHFAGSYWWLIFPIFGLASSAYWTWREGGKERHRRRLEIIAAKRGELLPDVTEPVSAASVRPESGKTQLRRLMDEHDGVTRRWLDYELDAAKLIAFPAMSDGRKPLTASFLRAKRVADALRPADVDGTVAAEELRVYRDAVADYAVKFDIAETDARRLRDADFTVDERLRLERAQQLLKTALDDSATKDERQLAYQRVRAELDGLIVLPDSAVANLEAKVSGEIAR